MVNIYIYQKNVKKKHLRQYRDKNTYINENMDNTGGVMNFSLNWSCK